MGLCFYTDFFISKTLKIMNIHQKSVLSRYPNATCFVAKVGNTDKYSIFSNTDLESDGIWLSGSGSFTDADSAWVRASMLLGMGAPSMTPLRAVDPDNLPNCQVFVVDVTTPVKTILQGSLHLADDKSVSCIGDFGDEVKNVTHYLFVADVVNYFESFGLF